ncbi:MAG: hypothetical protein ACFFCZ_12590 [Promethearchaeota archaeon]
MPWLQITQLEKVDQFLARVLHTSIAEVHQKFQNDTNIFVLKYFDPFSSLKGALIGSRNLQNIKIELIAFNKPLSAAQTEKILVDVRDFCEKKRIEVIIENSSSLTI